jgi:hypothetical protein
MKEKCVSVRVFNATFNNESVIAYNMVNSFIGVYQYFQQCVRYNVVTMFYVIPDTLLKVSLNTNKTGHHVVCIRYNVQHGDQFYRCLTTFSTKCQV